MKTILLPALMLIAVISKAQLPIEIYDFGETSHFYSNTNSGHYTYAVLNNKLMFAVQNMLWATNGITAGTGLVDYICPLCGFNGINATPDNFYVFNNNLYFNSADTTNGRQMWVSDGTLAGTQPFKIINANVFSSTGYRAGADLNGKFYFSANDGLSGEEPWVTDGAVSNTGLLADIFTGSASSSPYGFKAFNNKVYFFASSAAGVGPDLWCTDGTQPGTLLVKTLNASSYSDAFNLTECNGKLFFWANDGINGFEVWTSDGTGNGTQLLKDNVPGSGPSSGYWNLNFTVVGSKVYFQMPAATGGNIVLYATDGTSGGTSPVVTTQAGFTVLEAPMLAYNGKIFFSGTNGINGYELWSSDGTDAGTALVKDINTGGDANIYNMAAYNGKLYFVATDAANKTRLWQTEGIAANTAMVDSSLDMSDSSMYGLGDFVIANGSMYFITDNNKKNNGAYYGKLYRLTTTTGIEEPVSPSVNLYPDPASDRLNISGIIPDRLEVYGLEGREVLSIRGTANSIDVSQLPAGMYVAIITTGENTYHAKWVKQ